MDLKISRKHLELARKQLDNASTDSWEPAAPESCVANVFYAYENVVVALSEALDIPWKKTHKDKAGPSSAENRRSLGYGFIDPERTGS
jgi:hypothetical protein